MGTLKPGSEMSSHVSEEIGALQARLKRLGRDTGLGDDVQDSSDSDEENRGAGGDAERRLELIRQRMTQMSASEQRYMSLAADVEQDPESRPSLMDMISDMMDWSKSEIN